MTTLASPDASLTGLREQWQNLITSFPPECPPNTQRGLMFIFSPRVWRQRIALSRAKRQHESARGQLASAMFADMVETCMTLPTNRDIAGRHAVLANAESVIDHAQRAIAEAAIVETPPSVLTGHQLERPMFPAFSAVAIERAEYAVAKLPQQLSDVTEFDLRDKSKPIQALYWRVQQRPNLTGQIMEQDGAALVFSLLTTQAGLPARLSHLHDCSEQLKPLHERLRLELEDLRGQAIGRVPGAAALYDDVRPFLPRPEMVMLA